MHATPVCKNRSMSECSSELSSASSSTSRARRMGKVRNLGPPSRHIGQWSEGTSGSSYGESQELRRLGSSHLFSAHNLDQITEDDLPPSPCDPSISPDQENVVCGPCRVPFPSVSSPHKDISINGTFYKPLQVLGKGGSSQVLEAIDPSGSVRAIKVVDMSGSDSEVKSSFLNEIQVLKKLQGKARVIKMYDFQHKEENLYVVMEKGETNLGTLLRNSLSNSKLQFYWEEMLHVVKVIHAAGIIHSDLKPANFVLVSGMLKIIDFGISSSVQNDHTSIITHSLGGTCNFMSPEAIQGVDSEVGSPKVKISYKSDVWSLGCILYLMTYGKTPFYHIKAQYKKCQAIVDPSHVISYPKTAQDERLPSIISSCLNRTPQKRPTVEELLSHDYLKPISIPLPLSAIEDFCSPNTRQGILRAKSKLSQNNNPSASFKDT